MNARARAAGALAAAALALLAAGCDTDKVPPVVRDGHQGPLLEQVGEGEPPEPVRPPVGGAEAEPQDRAGEARAPAPDDAPARTGDTSGDRPAAPEGAAVGR